MSQLLTRDIEQDSLFPCGKRRVIETGFDGSDIISDGALLLHMVDRLLGLCYPSSSQPNWAS